MGAVSIQLSAEAERILARLGAAAELLEAVRAEMDRQNQLTVAHISTVRMMGNDWEPFPPELHILGVRTGRLRQSVRRSAAQVSGGTVLSSIGSNVKYAGIHELGGKIRIRERQGVARLRTDEGGNLLRQGPGGNLAVFARRRHKRVKEVGYVAKAHDIEMPARAPMTTGVTDRLEELGDGMSRAIVEAFEGGR